MAWRSTPRSEKGRGEVVGRSASALCGRGLTRLGEKVGIGRARKAANSGAGGSAGGLRGSARPRPGDFGRVGLRGVTWPRVRVRVV